MKNRMTEDMGSPHYYRTQEREKMVEQLREMTDLIQETKSCTTIEAIEHLMNVPYHTFGGLTLFKATMSGMGAVIITALKELKE